MNKPASLRAAISAAIADLAANPDKLLVFADEGSIAANGTMSLSFEYRYALNLILLDFAGDANQVMIAIIAWVKRHQPDLVNHPDKQREGITFEVDHLNHDTYDLSIKLKLTERIKVTAQPDGTYKATPQPEPIPEWETVGLGG